ncbi:hypothetical protein CF64_34320 [Bradyrhizobium japonicum]|nr:hypothetical protein CF64_34320 [Bradyrhizobium japonicum]
MRRALSGGDHSTILYASSTPSGALPEVDEGLGAMAPADREIAGRLMTSATTGAVTGNLGGACWVTHSSKAGTSPAMPCEVGNAFGSAAGNLSMTSSLVSV